MIKLLLSGKQLLLFIIIAWSLLIFVSYNVLTVQAEKYDKDEWVSGVTPDEWSDAEKYSDDSREQAHRYCAQLDYYDNNKKFCEKLAKGEEDTVFANEQGLKGEELEEEIAAQEDALCDNEDADTTKIEICMSDEQKKQSGSKDDCKEVNGDWKYGRCTFYEDYQSYEEEQQKQGDAQTQQQEEVIEDWGNTVSDSETYTTGQIHTVYEDEEQQEQQEEEIEESYEEEEPEQEEEESSESDDGGDSGNSSESEE